GSRPGSARGAPGSRRPEAAAGPAGAVGAGCGTLCRKFCTGRRFAAQRNRGFRGAAGPRRDRAGDGRIRFSKSYPGHLRAAGGEPLVLESVEGGFRQMMITVKQDATKHQIDAITKKIHELGFTAHVTAEK